ncbi:L-sorbose 1-dehydrogenase isoform X3 [Rhipicephalus sanguineus]|uniref:L-sorbose 1-dehydrogenase isoform X3 n=1 Tax=Rhipicephalus sanguineus TaxID=34632 RepID=UPI0020C27EA3|nr:L-sorbose 1-dehydrogenase isoform X3 [Rhipicephalus sanguineus]
MDLNSTVHAPWNSVPAAQPALALLYGVVNMLTHVPFTDLPVLGDYELGELRPYYDYVIVGGGSAGCVIANRLSADPSVTVLLLEAGGLEEASRQIPFAAPFNIRGRDDWDYWSVPQKHAAYSFRNQRLAHSRGKVLGGSSVLNFMMYTRGNPGDFDRWAREYGAEGWSYEDVLPHFKDIEDYRVGPSDECHGTGGEIPVDYANTSTPLAHLLMEACQQAGYAHVDFNGPTQSGCSRLQTNVGNGKRFSASKAFIQPIIRERKNLHVALLSHVTKVNFDGKRAVGVTFTRLGRPGKVNARREVILSAGTVGSTQLLLLSGVGPREDLERLQIPVVADLPVGRNLQDHPALIVGVPVSTDVEVGIPPFSLVDIQQYASNGTGTISIPVGNEFVQFLPTEYAEDPKVPDIEVATVAMSPASQLLKAFAVELGMLSEAFDGLIGPIDGRPGFRAITILNRPRSRGSISLRSKNPYEHPNIDPNMFEHPYDVKALAQGTKMFIDRILSADAMKSIGAKPSQQIFPPCADEGPLWSQEYNECLSRHTAIAAWHLCCTVAMGSHPEAVLDERLRVRGGVTGLRVADASVMPDVITGHTNAPSMMIGSKAASMIIEDNAAGPQ